MTIVLPAVVGTGLCRLMYDNLREQGTVVASSENPDFPVQNCFDWNTADYFQPAETGTITVTLTLSDAGTANYLAFYNQDLFLNAGSLRLQYWTGSAWTWPGARMRAGSRSSAPPAPANP